MKDENEINCNIHDKGIVNALKNKFNMHGKEIREDVISNYTKYYRVFFFFCLWMFYFNSHYFNQKMIGVNFVRKCLYPCH
jgi:hypothetical protein